MLQIIVIANCDFLYRCSTMYKYNYIFFYTQGFHGPAQHTARGDNSADLPAREEEAGIGEGTFAEAAWEGPGGGQEDLRVRRDCQHLPKLICAGEQ